MSAHVAERPDDGGRIARERQQFETLAQLSADSAEWFNLRDQIIEEHLPLAKYVAAKYYSHGSNHEDVLQTAYLGLVKAVDNFDFSKGFAFSTYATPVILGDVRKHFRDHTGAVRIPRDVQRLRTDLGRAAQAWAAEHGSAPSPQELATQLNAPLDDVIEALASTSPFEPLDESVADIQSSIDFDHVEAREAIKAAMAYLNETEREIVWLRFFENQTQSQIASRLNMSQTHVSRLQLHALDTLREHLG